jgi:hypothetical protein
MRSNVMILLARLARDARGTSVIETAFIAPVILMLLAGVSDFAMGFSLKLRTQQAAARTIEYATTAGLERLSFSDLRNEAVLAADVPPNQVEVLRWLECNGSTQPLFDGGCQSGEEIGRYVAVRISNSYRPVLGPLLPSSIADEGAIAFVGYSTVRLQ